jgi:hypothetical protein|nr:MAG TPA: hypothetical protein [Caudoviricetes sp.]
MSDMVYTLKPVKVCLDGDDCNVFDAYLVGYGRRGFCEQNSGGYEHPHFTKPEAMRVMRALNRDADNGIGDGTRYDYLFETDTFIENYDGDMMLVEPDIFGMYEMGIDMSWVLA